MVMKPYEEPGILQILRCLDSRLELDSDNKGKYLNLKKGNEGELRFARLLDSVPHTWLTLHDLLLECTGSIFQIDALLISQEKIYLFEVKNYEGDFYVDSGIWYTVNGKEIKDPVLQLTRCASLLRQLLQEYRMNLPIEARIIFINPEFTLYQAPMDLPIILPTQLNHLLKQLNMNSSPPGGRQRNLAEKLVRNHINESPYHHLPKYSYPQLKKGIVCAACSSLLTSLINQREVICTRCNHREKTGVSIMRSIKQFRLLFPDTTITTNIIHDWCKIIVSKKMIRRILSENFCTVGRGRSTYYHEKQ